MGICLFSCHLELDQFYDLYFVVSEGNHITSLFVTIFFMIYIYLPACINHSLELLLLIFSFLQLYACDMVKSGKKTSQTCFPTSVSMLLHLFMGWPMICKYS